MKKRIFYHHLWPTGIFLGLFTVLFGLIYPGLITLINQGVFPQQANGSLIFVNNQLRGSSLIGQAFQKEKYFWGRPSHTSLFAYNSASSAGANLGAANPLLHNLVRKRLDIFMADVHHGQPVPVDLICASSSGLDPHITPAAALYQVTRVAKARKLDEKMILQLIHEHCSKRQFKMLGEPRINVVELNLALDKMSLSNGRRSKT